MKKKEVIKDDALVDEEEKELRMLCSNFTTDLWHTQIYSFSLSEPDPVVPHSCCCLRQCCQ